MRVADCPLNQTVTQINPIPRFIDAVCYRKKKLIAYYPPYP